jgi:murein DD-endopeptidase MepM/ murein hydrolase activator NlpD
MVSASGVLALALAGAAVAQSRGPTASASSQLDSGPPVAGSATRSRVPVGGHPRYVVPFTPLARQRRAARRDALPPYWADGGACSVGCRPAGAIAGWPLRPFRRQHALRAGLNERRTGSMHVGIDIQARNAQRVYAIQSGRAQVTRAGIDTRVRVGNYIYWHIVPSVSTGQFVSAYRTQVGRVLTPAGHLHLSEVRGGEGSYLNPLRPGGRVLSPWRDRIGPVIGEPESRGGGRVDIKVYDPQSFVVRTTYPTPVLAPAALAYRVFDTRGRALTGLRWALRGTHVYPFSLVHAVYAADARGGGWLCFAYHPRCTPNWHYHLAGGLASPLPPLGRGLYRLSVYAYDWAQNITALDTTFAVQ